ncbi:hypothetical protein [Dyella acidiphila]|uniref:Uncharacterized protein n=1 Tax=Dyella acidiphila TaxID=2775866 RepID=A0ABR9G6K6_9GAMM|nr:hypothetical protein [Dyella acidiphila]MBE1159642.1 hypothetical protein [Dyella acidiphila]
MKTRKQLREILDDIEATVPEAKRRHADDIEFLAEIRSMVQLAILSAGSEDKDWVIAQVDALLMSHGIPVTVWSTQ